MSDRSMRLRARNCRKKEQVILEAEQRTELMREKYHSALRQLQSSREESKKLTKKISLLEAESGALYDPLSVQLLHFNKFFHDVQDFNLEFEFPNEFLWRVPPCLNPASRTYVIVCKNNYRVLNEKLSAITNTIKNAPVDISEDLSLSSYEQGMEQIRFIKHDIELYKKMFTMIPEKEGKDFLKEWPQLEGLINITE